MVYGFGKYFERGYVFNAEVFEKFKYAFKDKIERFTQMFSN